MTQQFQFWVYTRKNTHKQGLRERVVLHIRSNVIHDTWKVEATQSTNECINKMYIQWDIIQP